MKVKVLTTLPLQKPFKTLQTGAFYTHDLEGGYVYRKMDVGLTSPAGAPRTSVLVDDGVVVYTSEDSLVYELEPTNVLELKVKP